MKKMKLSPILLLWIVLCLLLTACQSDSSRADQEFSSPDSPDSEEMVPSFLLIDPEDISFGMSEGDLINKKGEGTRSETESIRIYSNQTGYYISEHTQGPVMFNYTEGYDFGDDNSLQTALFLLSLDQLSGDAVGYCIDDIMSMFRTEYGEPIGEGERWFDDTYKDDSGMLGYAIENGDYVRLALWEADGVQIAFYIGSTSGCYVAYTVNEEEIQALQAALATLQA